MSEANEGWASEAANRAGAEGGRGVTRDKCSTRQ